MLQYCNGSSRTHPTSFQHNPPSPPIDHHHQPPTKSPHTLYMACSSASDSEWRARGSAGGGFRGSSGGLPHPPRHPQRMTAWPSSPGSKLPKMLKEPSKNPYQKLHRSWTPKCHQKPPQWTQNVTKILSFFVFVFMSFSSSVLGAFFLAFTCARPSI